MESLQEKKYIRRVDGKRYGKWEVDKSPPLKFILIGLLLSNGKVFIILIKGFFGVII